MKKYVELEGQIVRDYEVAGDYPEHTRLTTSRERWVDGSWSSAPLDLFKVQDVILTSAYSAIDPHARRYFLNQTYDAVQAFFGLLPVVQGDKFSFSGEVNVWEGPHVVIGGPIDGVWHHWLIQWSARLAVLKMLRPEFLSNPEVRFLVDYRAYQYPFKAIFDAFGIPDHRLTLVDHALSHQLPEGYLLTFLDQNFYYPEVLEEFVRIVRQGLGIRYDPTARHGRLFCSRQGFTTAKRRIANFDEVEPILLEHGFDIVELGRLSASEQFSLFTQAEVVMGVHGADLVGLLFCPRGAQLLLMENERNIATGLAGTYRSLAELRGVRHSTMLVKEVIEPGADYKDFGPQHNRDYVIDLGSLRDRLAAIDRGF